MTTSETSERRTRGRASARKRPRADCAGAAACATVASAGRSSGESADMARGLVDGGDGTASSHEGSHPAAVYSVDGARAKTALEHFPGKACRGRDPGWEPVFRRKCN